MLKNGVIISLICVFIAVMNVSADMSYFAYNGQIRSIAYTGRGAKVDEGTVTEITTMGDKKYGNFWNIEFSGIMDVKADGKYSFTLGADDGCGLFIDGARVHGTLDLKAGKHQVNYLYYNYIGDHHLKALVTPPGGKACNIASVCVPSKNRQDLTLELVAAKKAAAERAKKAAAAAQRALVEISSPEALVRSIKHILKAKPRVYKNGREFLKKAQDYQQRMPAIIKGFEAENAESVKAMEEYGKLKYDALVAENPYVNFDETLVVLSDKVTSKANWLGTHVIAPKGYNNKIARLNLRTGKLTDIYQPKDGAFVGEMDLHWDAKKLLFSSTDDANMFQVMEVGVDGSNLRKVSLIDAEYVHNYGGVYLPSEKIVFSSTAPLIGVPCIGGSESVPNLYLMDADGANTRQLTFEQDADWYPSVLADGKIMYLRWEYTDIMHYYARIMMTMNPDGTNQRAIYGSQSLWPNSMFNARPLPGEHGKYSAVVTGHHGVAGFGKLTIFDTNKGYAHADGVVQHIPGYGKSVTHVTVNQLYPEVEKKLLVKFPELQKQVDELIAKNMPEDSRKGKDYHELNNDFFNTCYPKLRELYPYEMALDLDQLVNGVFPQFYYPYPISAQYFLTMAKLTASSDWALYLVDIFDNFVEIPSDQTTDFRYVTEPYPLLPRERPPVIPERVNLQDKEANCYIQDVYRGPGLMGVPVGVVDSLRLFTYAYGYYKIGNHHHLGVESGWDVKRVLGTVKVETDGSAMFKIPANTTISIQPLDKEGRALQLFRSWLVAMPGEDLSCVGCHEAPTEPPVTTKTIASGKKPQRITPHRGQLKGYDFNSEIQPVLDAYCVRCHDDSDPKKPNFKDTSIAKKGNSANYSVSYYAFHKYFRRPGPESSGIMANPCEYHAATSEGCQLIEKGHYGVKLDDESMRRIYTWIDLNVPFYGSWTAVYSENQGRSEWTAKISKQSEALRSKYAFVDADWEQIPSQPYSVKICTTKGAEKSAPVSVSVKNWPFDAATAQAMQSKAGKERTKILDLGNGLKITMVRIPDGEFIMGSDDDTPQEQPRHTVKIKRAFWISENEINNEIFFAFKPDHNASVFDQQWKDHVRLGYYACYSEQPAVRMSWHDAKSFCEWVAAKTKAKVSLPTEAQWEWACRAGSDTAMSFGSVTDDFSAYANLADKSIEKFAVNGVNPVFNKGLVGNPVYDFVPRISEFDDGQFLVTGTKQYKQNVWGLYDMHGNVAEWTLSDYVSYPYNARTSNSMGEDLRKVVRGGSFFDRPYRATSSWRFGYAPWMGVYNVGFRIVMED